MASTPIELLQHYKVGDRLRAEDINGIIDAAQQNKSLSGFNDGNVEAQTYKAKSGSDGILHYKNSTGATLPRYSVFCPSGTPSAFGIPPLGDMDSVGVTAPGSPFVYLTNGQIEIPDTRNCEVRIIPFDAPTLLRVNAAAVPAIWEPCGVEFETNQLCSTRLGFVCLSAPTVVGGVSYIWAARTREPIKVIGKAYGAITAYNSGTGVLGTGLIKIWYRNPAASEAIALAKAPQAKATPLLAQVWNKGAAIADDTLISATDSLGIGLVVDDKSVASQNYVEYKLNKNLNGFNGVLKLDSTHLTGWPGSLSRAGSESDAKIEYQTSETAPQTNGLWKATSDGLFRITLSGAVRLDWVTTPSSSNQDIVTTGAASTGTPHNHPVQQTGLDAWIRDQTPELAIWLYNKKASGGAIAAAADADTDFFKYIITGSVTGSDRYYNVCSQWNVCLHQNDKVSLKFIAQRLTYFNWECVPSLAIRMRFEYIGPIADWATI